MTSQCNKPTKNIPVFDYTKYYKIKEVLVEHANNILDVLCYNFRFDNIIIMTFYRILNIIKVIISAKLHPFLMICF